MASTSAGWTIHRRPIGNTTYDGHREHTYDAWNRIKITHTWTGDHTVQDRDYDALGRLIVSKAYEDGALARTDKYYYNPTRQQIIEVRNGSDNVERHVVYGSQYIDHRDHEERQELCTSGSRDPTPFHGYI